MTKPFNREIALRVKKKIEAGFRFPLPDTTRLLMGLSEQEEVPEEELLDARVKKLSIPKLATLTGLSPTMQNAVLAVFDELDKFAKVNLGDEDDLESEDDPWATFAEGVQHQENLRDGACIAGFIDPPLCETQEEAENDPTGKLVWVGSLAEQDRQRYLSLVLSPESEAAKALEPFLENGVEGAAIDQVVSITTSAKRRSSTKRGGGA